MAHPLLASVQFLDVTFARGEVCLFYPNKIDHRGKEAECRNDKERQLQTEDETGDRKHPGENLGIVSCAVDHGSNGLCNGCNFVKKVRCDRAEIQQVSLRNNGEVAIGNGNSEG